MTSATRRLRIAQVAPPVERVPPAAYGGTERVVHELAIQLVDRGHDVTVFASGDSDVPGRLVPTVERALRPAGIESDAGGWFATTVKMVIEQATEFDVIHSHLEWWSIPLARLSPVPVVATFHGRLDLPWADRLLRDAPDGMVAISRHQASTHPDVPWTIIHNGLTLDRAPFLDQPGDAFCFVGRVDAEKGIIEAIDIALRAGRRLRIAAKVGNLARQRDYYESVFRPALQRAGRSVEYLGEIQPAERDQLFAESYATLMPGAWPEPFGLVSIESLACGTPVLARRVGALPEIIREGVDGFFGDDTVAMAFFADRLGGLDRREIRERVIERFSAARMADRYEDLYTRMIEAPEAAFGLLQRTPDAAEVEEALSVQLPTEVTEPADAELPREREAEPGADELMVTEAASIAQVELPEAKAEAEAEAVVTDDAEETEATEPPGSSEEPTVFEAPTIPEEPVAPEESEEPEVAQVVEVVEVVASVDVAPEREALSVSIAAEASEEAPTGAAASPEEEAPPVEPEPVVAEVPVPESVALAEVTAREAPPDAEVMAPEAPPDAEVIAPRAAPAAAPPAPAAPPPAPAVRPPVAVGPGSPGRPPEPMVSPARPASKPAAKPPRKPISVFTRLWSGSSRKTAGTRRRDRS